LHFNPRGVLGRTLLRPKTPRVRCLRGLRGSFLERRVALGQRAGLWAARWTRIGVGRQVSQRRFHGSFRSSTHARQPELGEGGHDQPRPAIRLLGVANPGRGPSHAPLEEAEGVLRVEAPDVGAPEESQIRPRSFPPVPPWPQNPRLAPPLAAGQPLDLDQDQRPDGQGQGSRLPCPSWLRIPGGSFEKVRTSTVP
jgi:hypothetical protein